MTSAASEPLIFVQLEFSHALGVPVGRFPAPGGAVLMLDVIEGSPAPQRRRRRNRASQAPGQRPVSLALATYVPDAAAAPHPDWRADQATRDALIAAAVACVNTAIRAARAATHDPYVMEITRSDARAVRIGRAPASDLYEGAAVPAEEIVAPAARKAPRDEQVRITQEVAEALRGRLRPYEGEELALRALLDATHGRARAAIAGAAAASEVLRDELGLEPVPDRPPLDLATAEAVARHVLEIAAAHRAEQLRALREGAP